MRTNMEQLRLFPPPGSTPTPLPIESLNEVRELLAEMLVVVIENNKGEHASKREGETDE